MNEKAPHCGNETQLSTSEYKPSLVQNPYDVGATLSPSQYKMELIINSPPKECDTSQNHQLNLKQNIKVHDQ